MRFGLASWTAAYVHEDHEQAVKKIRHAMNIAKLYLICDQKLGAYSNIVGFLPSE